MFGDISGQMWIVILISVAIGAAIVALLLPGGNSSGAKRLKALSEKSKGQPKATIAQRLMQDDTSNSRRKQLQESLKQLEADARNRKRKKTIRVMLSQAGLETSERTFWLISLVFAAIVTGAVWLFGGAWFVAAGAGLAAGFGLPRWFLGYLRRRREQAFLNEFADAIDVMTRGLKAGLPVTDAMKVIAAESPAPVGPEFLEVVEGQRVGITIDQGIERMYERMPLAEVNFLAIVMAIQSKAGGNLAEALGNLSKVLRDRKRMKAKIRSVSQEAKSSAMIIGALPFCITAALAVLNPEYLTPLWTTRMGNILLVGSGLWMLTGCLVMRKMINFDF
ncbi:MAG: type II secretion system F family protein [Pseudomonadota bacterium]|nr:type II secretion system F family protein [Pseudomonadota bacterium]